MSSKAKSIARRLLRQNRGTRSIPARSWRVIARDDYKGQINYATLCRFAISQGEWIPKDERLQVVLGLKRERKATHAQPKDLFDMATDTLRNALIHREPMPPLDPRIVKQFIKLGWMKRERVGAR
jgi:hypothetical protein